jgi:pilus assembly protein TadC
MLERMARRAGEIVEVSQLYPAQAKARLRRALLQAGSRLAAEDWLALTTLAPPSLGGLLALLAYAQAGDAATGVLAGSLSLALSFFFLWQRPFSLARGRAKSVERELPFALRALAVELASKMSFERALRHISRGYGEWGKELRRALHEIEGGASVGEALKAVSERVDSLEVQRVVVQLVLSYEQGGSGEGLRKLAEELSLAQRAQVREYNAKLAFTGLMFISLACVVPALFAAYVIVGSSFLQLSFSSTDVYLAYLFVFPLVDALVLWYSNRSKPMAIGA